MVPAALADMGALQPEEPDRGPCGDKLRHAPDVTTPAGWTMCYVLKDDPTNPSDPTYTTCRELLVNVGHGGSNGYANETVLTAAGGNFGCWKSATGVGGINPSYACKENYQQWVTLSGCTTCDSLGVCIKLP